MVAWADSFELTAFEMVCAGEHARRDDLAIACRFKVKGWCSVLKGFGLRLHTAGRRRRELQQATLAFILMRVAP